LKQIKVIRIGTRLPVSDPKKINKSLIQILKQVNPQVLYLLLHFEHPDELERQRPEGLLNNWHETGLFYYPNQYF